MYTKKILEGRSDAGLYSTCGGCHFKAEFRQSDGKKLNPKQATAKMKQMRTWREKRKKAFVDWFVGEENQESGAGKPPVYLLAEVE